MVIDTAGGLCLDGRLALLERPRGGLVVCHPHPLYGGDMDNPVVIRAATAAQDAGLATLRFNFRGVGLSQGVHGGGEGERDDAIAAMGMIERQLPPGRPLGLVGYSFGAWVAARVSEEDSRVRGLCLIAPPLGMFDWGFLSGGKREVLLVTGTRDSYCAVDGLERLAERLPGAQTAIVENADHFFFGKLFPLGEALLRWVSRWAPG